MAELINMNPTVSHDKTVACMKITIKKKMSISNRIIFNM